MKPATIEEKRELIQQSRGKNYSESLRLAGFNTPQKHRIIATKADLLVRLKNE